MSENIFLTDDQIVSDVAIGFDFTYYGYTYSKLNICSNGWVSFEPCLKAEGASNACNPLPYFYNNSMTFTSE